MRVLAFAVAQIDRGPSCVLSWSTCTLLIPAAQHKGLNELQCCLCCAVLSLGGLGALHVEGNGSRREDLTAAESVLACAE